MLLHLKLFIFTFLLKTVMGTFQGATRNNISKPGCPTECGNILVPYPFGIGEDCSLDAELFSLTCNTSYKPPKLFLGDGNIQIYNISDFELRIFTTVSYACYNQSGYVFGFTTWVDLVRDTTFSFSKTNKFTVVGCDDYALITGTDEDDFTSGCFGRCHNPYNVPYGQCTGIGCCQISLPMGLSYYNVSLDTLHSHVNVWPFNECSYAFLVEEGGFKFQGITDLSTNYSDFVTGIESSMVAVVDWVIAPSRRREGFTVCKGNSSCYNVEGGGYRCKCNYGYEGNPYLHPGCYDINECNDNKSHTCYGVCKNTVGSYTCTCPFGSFGNASALNGCVVVPPVAAVAKDSKHLPTLFIIALSLGMGVFFLVAIIVLYKVIKKTKDGRRRKMFFTRNGGLLLKRQEEADPSLVDKTILFTSRELDKATDNFNVNRILGRGGHGTVYKGMLVDGRIVAVKRSKTVDESQLEQFINEVVILSQISHRNVVKLLGCCLETDVPMLVSEYIPNGTLYDRLHNETEEFPISLNMRLQIATEVAGALAYLHSATSIPIYHRDIKTSNILLDEKYRAKVSDFGTSRFVSIEQTHLTTLVKGTFGYLDPEYFQSNQFTEKSDVYSFGVVLVEFLIREKPISLTKFGENRSLAIHFMLAMEEGRVMSVFDAFIVNEGTRDELLALASLAMRCLNMNGKNRPSMKEVVIELETIRTSHIPSIIETNINPVIYGEDMHLLPHSESSSTFLSFNNSISH